MAEQGIDEIAARLYTVEPTRFVAARTEAVRRARETGDHGLASALGRLRRPTLSAWAVNLLVRSAQQEMAGLATLGQELHVAQRQLHAAQLRRLNQQRRELIGTLSRRARQLAADAGHPLGGTVLVELEQTLAAALTDTEAAQAVCSGRLIRPLQSIGLGAELSSASSAPPEDDLARQRRRREQRLARDLARADQELGDAVARAARTEQEVRRAAERCADLDRRLVQLQRERDGAQREHAEALRRAQSAVRVRDEAQRRVQRLAEERHVQTY